MTEIQSIKKLIVEYTNNLPYERSPTARDINKAVAKAIGWYYYTPSEAREKFNRNYKRGAWIHPEDCTDGKPVFCQMHGTEVHNNCPDFIHSIDAQKALEVENWYLHITQIPRGWSVQVRKAGDFGSVKFESGTMQTEACARLYCWLCVREWEEENG